MAITTKKSKKKPKTSKVRFSGYVESKNKEGIAEIAKLLDRSENYVMDQAFTAYINANLQRLKENLK